MTLELLSNPGSTLADVARAVALADVVEKVVKARREELRDGPLADLASEAAKLTGSDGFTSRIEGVGQVIQTAPSAKVRVSDAQAFGEWLDEMALDHIVECRDRVHVIDHDEAARCIRWLDDNDDEFVDHAESLRNSLKLVTEWYPAENAVDEILTEGWAVVRSDMVFSLDPDTGAIADPVPGLSVSRAAQKTYVKPDSKARKRVTAQVREALALDGDT